jgi:hypothetical protein
METKRWWSKRRARLLALACLLAAGGLCLNSCFVGVRHEGCWHEGWRGPYGAWHPGHWGPCR